MHVQAWLTGRPRISSVIRKSVPKKGALPRRSAVSQARARIVQRVPKILTSPARNSVTGMPRNPRHTWDHPPGPPEKPHLIEKSGAPTDAKAAPEKPHRNRRGIKNVNGIRYLCAAGVRVGPAIIPRKTSPFRHPAECDSCLSAPENSHLCQKVAQRKSDFGQSGRAFQRIFPVMPPEKSHLWTNF